MSLYLAALFVAFVPGVLVTLPPRSSRNVVLAVHALLFALVWHFTNRMVFRMLYEGFQNNNMAMNNSTNNSENVVTNGNSGNVVTSGNGMSKMANSAR